MQNWKIDEFKLYLYMRNKKHDLTQDEFDYFYKIVTTNKPKQASEILGISQRSVYNYMDDLGIKKSGCSLLKQKLAKIKK